MDWMNSLFKISNGSTSELFLKHCSTLTDCVVRSDTIWTYFNITINYNFPDFLFVSNGLYYFCASNMRRKLDSEYFLQELPKNSLSRGCFANPLKLNSLQAKEQSLAVLIFMILISSDLKLFIVNFSTVIIYSEYLLSHVLVEISKENNFTWDLK